VLPVVVVLVIGVVAWRYRRVLGLGKGWDGSGRDQVDDLAARLGWSNREAPGRPTQTRARPSLDSGPRSRSFYPAISTRRLPIALAIGVVEGIVVVDLDLGGHTFLAFLAGIVVGPFLGGLYVRSLWWPVVAALVAIVVGAGGEIGTLLVAIPVASIGYAGIRTDAAGWIARLNAETDDPSQRA